MPRFSPYELDEYVLERLPLNKRITLECELEEDKQLLNEVEKRKRVINSIRQIGRDSLLEEFENWDIDTESYPDKAKEKEKKEKKEYSLPPIASYLTVAFIMAIVYWIASNYDPTKNFSTSKAYEFYFEPVSINVIFPNKKDPEYTADREIALTKYKNKDYAGAIEDMKAYLSENDDATIHMFSGISYLAIGQNETGIQKLIYAGNRDKDLLAYTNWFIALSYMNTNQLKESQEYLQRVTDLGGYYAGKARELFHMSGGVKLDDREIEQF